MPLLLFLAFVIVPIIELYVIIQVGQEVGVPWTVALLIIDSLIGTWLLRHQGRGAWGRFQGALERGRLPGREVMDGALIILGGALLLTPGFITDLFGLALLLPPSRAVIRGVLARTFAGRVVLAAGHVPVPRRRPPANGDVIEGTAIDADGPERRR